MVQYAVNIADLTKYTRDFLVQVMLLPVVDRGTIVDAEPGRVDGTAAVLRCGAEQAEAIVQQLRQNGYHPNLLRLYRLQGRRWTRIR